MLKTVEMKSLEEMKNDFETTLIKSTEALTAPSVLLEALQYAFDGGGKRIRPLIVFIVQQALGFDLDVTRAALAAEYFHTASLIADDLPCMDNDNYRRDRYSLHKAYGETVALLTSYGMITEGFRKIYEAIEVLKASPEPFCYFAEKVGLLALECATRCSGYSGAVSGQFHDLFPVKRDFEMLKKIIHLKTSSLFEASFFFGWIFGGGCLGKVEEVRILSHHFGMAFQIADDIRDYDQDKDKKNTLNTAVFLGLDKAKAIFQGEMDQFNEKVDALNLRSAKMQILINLILEV
jgi:geranylgeranyl diphosphate synthase type II